MEQVVSATEARVHFGEIMRRVVETGTPVIVERDGKAQVVIVSKPDYDDTHNGGARPNWRDLVKRSRDRIRDELHGKPFPPPEDIIRQMREERDAYLADLR
jgi:prevent-host-death family protein